MISCKGEYDSLVTIDFQKFSLLYPYYFDDAKIEFKAKFKSYDYYDDNNFEVTIDHKGDADLSTGTNKALKLDEFYKYHNREAADIYRQIMILKSRARFYYKNFNLPKSAFNPTPELVLGFRFNKENSRKELLYKLKKDTFEQFLCYYHF